MSDCLHCSDPLVYAGQPCTAHVMIDYQLADLPPEIAARIVVNQETGCWEWQHRFVGPDPERYGSVQWNGICEGVHRAVYKLLVGPLPDDRPHLDHVYAWGCRANSCCWPNHLEPVTHSENSSRRCLVSRSGVAKTVQRRYAATRAT